MSRHPSPRPRRTFGHAAVLAFALVVSTHGSARAGGPSTVAYAQRFALQQGTYARTISLPPFDTNLGHLVGVSYQVQYFARWFLQVENAESSAVFTQTAMQCSLLAQCALQGPGVDQNLGVLFSQPLGPFDGAVDFAGPSGFRAQNAGFPAEQLLGTDTQALTAGALFEGDAWIPFPVLAQAATSQAGISVGQFESSIETALQVTIVYTYDAGTSDCNANGVPDRIEVCVFGAPDVNHNAIPDSCETGEVADCNLNGVTDATDIANGTSVDLDGNQIPDECNLDCDGDGILDACDAPCPIAGSTGDCNHNGLPDDYDVFHDPSLDQDGNGIIDACEGALQLVDCACETSLYGAPVPDAHGFAPHVTFGGTCKISDGNFALVAHGCPPNRTGLFVCGTEQDSVPFGLGTLRVGGTLRRFPAVTSDANGVARKPIAFDAPGFPIGPHVPLCFQFVYRAPSAQGPTVNVSDALSMTFCP